MQHGSPLSQNSVASTRKNDLMLVAGALDTTIKLYRVAASLSTRTHARSESAPMDAVSTSLCLDTDGETVAVGYQNGMCALFSLKTVGRRETKMMRAEISESEAHVASGGAAAWLHGPTSITYVCVDYCVTNRRPAFLTSRCLLVCLGSTGTATALQSHR